MDCSSRMSLLSSRLVHYNSIDFKSETAADSCKEQPYYGFNAFTWHFIIDHVLEFYEVALAETLMRLQKSGVGGDEKLIFHFMCPYVFMYSRPSVMWTSRMRPAAQVFRSG